MKTETRDEIVAGIAAEATEEYLDTNPEVNRKILRAAEDAAREAVAAGAAIDCDPGLIGSPFNVAADAAMEASLALRREAGPEPGEVKDAAREAATEIAVSLAQIGFDPPLAMRDWPSAAAEDAACEAAYSEIMAAEDAIAVLTAPERDMEDDGRRGVWLREATFSALAGARSAARDAYQAVADAERAELEAVEDVARPLAEAATTAVLGEQPDRYDEDRAEVEYEALEAARAAITDPTSDDQHAAYDAALAAATAAAPQIAYNRLAAANV